MRGLDDEQIIKAWERCHGVLEPARALVPLEMSMPEKSTECLLALPLHERNTLLLSVRARTFGRWIDASSACPACGEQLEFRADTDRLIEELEKGQRPSGSMRHVNTSDLLACLEAKDDDEARAILIGRSLGRGDGKAESFTQEMADDFDAKNVSAEIGIEIECEACSTFSVLDLDIGRFFSKELGLAARRLLHEVQALAEAFGWSERSILGMSPMRRTAYLELLGA